MERRTFVKSLALSAVSASALSMQSPAQAGDKERPNLLIIHTDEHNFRTLGCYRKTLPPEQAYMWGKDTVVETPHIDWIAEHGTLCTKFYATSPVCTPSRASFVSGQYPHNAGSPGNNLPLKKEVVTFAEVFRRNGYATGYAGKWHLDGKGKPQWGPKRQFGFEENRYMFNRGHWKKMELTARGPRVLGRNKKGRPDYSIEGADEKSFTTDFLTDRTIEFLQAHKDGKKPFCYMLSIPDPHGPDTVRAPYDTLYKDMKFKRPRTHGKTTFPKWAPKAKYNINQSKYFGMVKCIDDNVGRILKTLTETGLLKNTIVIYTADHGDLLGEHHRKDKGVPFEASAKVPFVISYPKLIKSGALIHETLATVDFKSTILNLMGLQSAGPDEGRNGARFFTEGKKPEGWEDIIFMRKCGEENQGWVAAVNKRYKLVLDPREEPWLLDLEKDPDELVNFAQVPEYKKVVGDLARQLMAYGKTHADPYAADPKVKEDLATLVLL